MPKGECHFCKEHKIIITRLKFMNESSNVEYKLNVCYTCWNNMYHLNGLLFNDKTWFIDSKMNVYLFDIPNGKEK